MPADDRLDDLLSRAFSHSDAQREDSVSTALAAARTLGARKRRVRRVGSGAALLAPIVVLAVLFWPSGEPDRMETVSEATTTTSTVRTTEWTAYEDTANGITVDVPPGWSVAPAPLTPAISRADPNVNGDPSELLTLGTGTMAHGWSLGCNPPTVPEAALDAMSTDDVLVQVLERRARFDEALPERPDDLRTAAGGPWTAACVDPPADLYRLAFSVEGTSGTWAPREIGLLVAIGTDADESTEDELWNALDRMTFSDLPDHREALVMDPPEDIRSPGVVLRLDAAVEAIPFDAYPWFQYQWWTRVDYGTDGTPDRRDRRAVLVVAPASSEFLARSITPDLETLLSDSTTTLPFDREGVGSNSISMPVRWRWWSPRPGLVAFLGGTDITDAELDAMVASSRWELQRVDPRVSGWQAPNPPVCANALTVDADDSEGAPLEAALANIGRSELAIPEGRGPSQAWDAVLATEIIATSAPTGVLVRQTVPTPGDVAGVVSPLGVPFVQDTCWSDG